MFSTQPIPPCKLKIKIVHERNVNCKFGPMDDICRVFFCDGEIVRIRFLEFHALESKARTEQPILPVFVRLIGDDGFLIADRMPGSIRHVNFICRSRDFSADRVLLIKIQREYAVGNLAALADELQFGLFHIDIFFGGCAGDF